MDLTNLNNFINQAAPIIKTVAEGVKDVNTTIQAVKGSTAPKTTSSAPGTVYVPPTPSSGITTKQILIGGGILFAVVGGGYLLLRK